MAAIENSCVRWFMIRLSSRSIQLLGVILGSLKRLKRTPHTPDARPMQSEVLDPTHAFLA
jgi:hypothetical protein